MNQRKPFNAADFCIAYETTTTLTEKQTIAGFQKLINGGYISSLQGHYQRTAKDLIDSGKCKAKKKKDIGTGPVESDENTPHGHIATVVVNLTNNTDFAGDRTYITCARDGRVYQIQAKPHEAGYDIDAGTIFFLPVQGSTDIKVEKIDWRRIRRSNGNTFSASYESIATGETGYKNTVEQARIDKAWKR